MFSGINFAAAVGDILFAVPTLCLGGLQLLYAASGSYPRRWMSPSGVTHRLTNVEGSSHP